MSERSHGPQGWQASGLQSYPSQPAPPSRDRLGSSAVAVYLKLLHPFAIVGNLAVIATVPAECVVRRLSALRKIARRDQETAE